MRVLSPKEMRLAEEVAKREFYFSESLIIENVGAQGARTIAEDIIPQYTKDLGTEFKEIVFLIGEGNNGADGLAIARHLTNSGWNCRAFILFPEKAHDIHSTKAIHQQFLLAKAFGVKCTEVQEIGQLTSYLTDAQPHYCIVDAIYGTGLKLPISQYLFEVINVANNASTVMISIDIPSGITGNNGLKSGAAIHADFTLAIGVHKKGYYSSVAHQHVGHITVLDAGIPKKVFRGGDKFLITKKLAQSLFKGRNKLAYKNLFGHVLVVGGSLGMTGAAVLASTAAMKSGAGLVTVATWPEAYQEMLARLTPEIMSGVVPREDEKIDHELRDLGKYSTIVVGPGLSQTADARRTVLNILANFNGPVVVDADAINVLDLKRDAALINQRTFPTILTPHMGEFARLVGVPTKKVLKYPTRYLKELVDNVHCPVILKAACSYIGMPNGNLYFNYYPNDGLAKAGSGDTLAGIIAGLLAQALPLSSAKNESGRGQTFIQQIVEQNICLGTYLHSQAGLAAAKKLGSRGMVAMDLIDHLQEAFRPLDENLIKKNNGPIGDQ